MKKLVLDMKRRRLNISSIALIVFYPLGDCHYVYDPTFFPALVYGWLSHHQLKWGYNTRPGNFIRIGDKDLTLINRKKACKYW